MSIRKILVPLAGNDGDVLALDAATYIANKLGAQITGLHVRSSGDAAIPFLGVTASGAVIEEILDRIEAVPESLAKKVESGFRTWADKATLSSGTTSSFVEISGDRDGLLAAHARRSDLIVMRGLITEDDAGIAADIEAVAMDSGRPVLLLPEKVSENLANKIIVAWNDSVESSRAAGAMPLLKAADSVTVAGIKIHVDDTLNLEPIADWIKSHGAEVGVSIIGANNEEISDVLIQHTRRHDGALLVMGAYSHSRLREQVLGGVTQDILDYTEVPVLLIH
jgi:nucleotide-binding universal stress UspA family protein